MKREVIMLVLLFFYPAPFIGIACGDDAPSTTAHVTPDQTKKHPEMPAAKSVNMEGEISWGQSSRADEERLVFTDLSTGKRYFVGKESGVTAQELEALGDKKAKIHIVGKVEGQIIQIVKTGQDSPPQENKTPAAIAPIPVSAV